MSTAPDYAPLCAPPDREPRAPRTAFPPLACDTHAHIFEARFPYAKERLYTPPDSNLDDYKKLLKTLGCERAVLVQPSVYLRPPGAAAARGARGVDLVEKISARQRRRHQDHKAEHASCAQGSRPHAGRAHTYRGIGPNWRVARSDRSKNTSST